MRLSCLHRLDQPRQFGRCLPPPSTPPIAVSIGSTLAVAKAVGKKLEFLLCRSGTSLGARLFERLLIRLCQIMIMRKGYGKLVKGTFSEKLREVDPSPSSNVEKIACTRLNFRAQAHKR